MDPAGLSLALLATADLCLKSGKKLAALCSDFNHADLELREMLLAVKSLWYRIARQLVVVRNIAASLDDEYLIFQNQQLAILQSRLQELHFKLDKLLDTSSFLRKIKYMAYAKTSLEESLKDLEKWYRRWDPSWMVLARLEDPKLDAEIYLQSAGAADGETLAVVGGLRKAHRIILANTSLQPLGWLPNGVTWSQIQELPFSSAVICTRSDSHDVVLIDKFFCQPEISPEDASRDVQSLGYVLSKVDPFSCNLLACQGIRQDKIIEGGQRSFSFVFTLPKFRELPSEKSEHSTPDPAFINPEDQLNYPMRSLRDLLLIDGAFTTSPSLTLRLEIAKSLARSIISLHSASFVHKNIRPETVLTIPSSGRSYLVGFQHFRQAEGTTYRVGDASWYRDLYRHPMRQGQWPSDAYRMQHDVYSLGVCLLEIGLWTPFVRYGDRGEADHCGLAEIVGLMADLEQGKRRAFEVKRTLTAIAERELPGHVGDKYTKVVVLCLTCLDKDGEFGHVDKTEGEVSVRMGVRYIEKILNEIETISI